MREIRIKFNLLFRKITCHKLLLNLLGGIFAISGAVFVFLRLENYSKHINYQVFDAKNLIYFCCVALTYGCASIILGCIWRDLLSFSGENKSYYWSIRVYGVSQLAKYVPGNIFHFAGRQVMGMAQGGDPKALIKSTLYEVILLVCSGSLFSIIIIPEFYDGITLSLAVSFFFLIVFFVCFILFEKWGSTLVFPFFLQVCFLMISGLTFFCVVSFIVKNPDFSFSSVIIIAASFVTAWLIGLVTPGAPAGLGVREFILLFLLKGLIKEQDLLLAIIASRIITVSGDVIFFLISIFLPKSAEIK